MRMSGIIALLAILAAQVASAGDGHDATAVVEHIFEMADRDGDGRLSPEEYEKAGLQRFGVSFDESDLDSDGETSLAEYLELYHLHHPPVEDGSA